MSALTEKQLGALRALAEPDSDLAWIFWAEARASWPGPRKTLGSLVRHGLVSYDATREITWQLTDEGRAALEGARR